MRIRQAVLLVAVVLGSCRPGGDAASPGAAGAPAGVASSGTPDDTAAGGTLAPGGAWSGVATGGDTAGADPARPGGAGPTLEVLRELADARGQVRVIAEVDAPFVPEGDLPDPAARAAQRAGIAAAQQALAARVARPGVELDPFETIPFVVVLTDRKGLDDLSRDPAVLSLVEDGLRRPVLDQSVPLVGGSAAQAAGYTGSGQAVAILDSGVDKTHSFLGGRVVAEGCYSSAVTNQSVSFCPGGGSTSTATGSGVNCASSIDGCSHGTHVAGIAAGSGPSFDGMAPDASIVAMQVFARFDGSSNCSPYPTPCILSYDSDRTKALQRVLTLVQGGTAVAAVNMSIGGGYYTSTCDSVGPAEKAAIDNLRSVGTATVIASGNDGYADGIGYPACLSSGVSVGATTNADAVTSFSNSSAQLDLLAPGKGVNSSVIGGTFESWDGTSMATPHVTGAWALLKQKDPTLGVAAALALLKSTGVPVTDASNGLVRPRIQVDDALDGVAAAQPTFSPAPGTYTTAQSVTVSTTTAGATLRVTTDGTAPTAGSPVYTGPVVVPLQTTTTLRAKAFHADFADSPEGSATYVVTDTVATPQLSPAPGTYTTAQSVSLSTSTPGATIRYTTNGTTPNTGSSIYSSPLSVPLATQRLIRAKAYKSTWATSDEASGLYDVTGTVATPTASPGPGTSTTAVGVTLSTTTPTALIRYTTDGSAPTASSTLYSGAIVVGLDSTLNLRARAFRTGWLDSGELSGTWIVTGKVAAPGFTPAPALYTSEVDVEMASATPSSSLRYTTDGSTPTASSTLYTGAVRVGLGAATTFKVRAFRPGWTDSDVTTGTFVVTGTVQTPTFAPAPGAFTTAQAVVLSTATPGAVVRYTTDGSAPTSSSRAYTLPVAVPVQSTVRIRARAYRADWADSGEADGTFVVTDTVATPTFSPPPGVFTTAQAVALTTVTPTAVVRYTTDGTDPTATSPVYAGPVALGLQTTTELRARAFRDGWGDSAVAVGTFRVTDQVATPTFTPVAGSYDEAQDVVIATSTPGAVLHVTTDGSTPTTASAAYTGAVTVPRFATTTLKVLAVRPEWADAAVASATYVVTGPVAAPTFDPAPGLYTAAQAVTVTSTTPSAVVHYTTDGSAPTASSPVFSGPLAVPLDTSVTVRALATRAGWADSPGVEATYRVTGQVAAPLLSLAPGTYTTAQSVTASSATPGAVVRWTTDGTAPTATSPVASGPLALPLDSTTRVRARAFLTDWADSAEVDATFVVTGTVATPSFSPAPGAFTAAQSVAITSGTAGAVVRYTTDGSAPTASSTLYSGPVSLGVQQTHRLRVRAFRAAWVDSAEADGTFEITDRVATPVFSLSSGTYTTAQGVSLSTPTPGAVVRYTTDGSDPTSSSALAGGALALALQTTTTVKARAFRDGWADSDVLTGTFEITDRVAPVQASPAPGLYTAAQVVVLTTPTPQAVIHYTTDGTSPGVGSPVASGGIVVPLQATTTIRAIALRTAWAPSATFEGTWTVTGTVQTPVITPAAGTYTAPPAVSATTGTPGATLRYTLDGSDPTASSPVLTGPPTLPADATTTVSVRGFRQDWADSGVARATFRVTGTVAAPTFSPPGGSFDEAQLVTVATTTPGTTLHVTTDGSTPTLASPVYTGPIAAPRYTTTTLRVLAVRPDWADAPVTSATYEVTGPVAMPTLDPAPGLYTTAQTVTVASTTPSAVIRYTTDGSVPGPSSLIATGPLAVPLDSTLSLRAIATRAGWADSAEVQGVWRVTGGVAAPQLSLAPGTYTVAKSLTVSTSTPGAVVRWTTDGTAPTSSSPPASGPLALPLQSTTRVRARAYLTDWADSPEVDATFVITDTVAAPVFSPAPGSFTTPQTVTVSTSTPDAVVRYTTDGSDPSASSPVFAAAVEVGLEETVHLRVRAFRTDWADSPVVDGVFEVTDRVALPSFSLAPGTYTTAQQVSLATTTPGAVVRFTTDGTDPTSASPLASAPLALPLQSETTVRARGFLAGWADSAVAVGTFRITDRVAPVLASPAPGTSTTARLVTLSTATPGASVRYTTDGTEPLASSPVATAPIPVPLQSTLTLRAVAVRDAWADSEPFQGTWIVTDTVQAPRITPDAGTYTSPPAVTATSGTPGATLRYTVDGSDPTASSAVLSSPVVLPGDATTTVAVRAFRGDWADSAVARATFVVTGTVATPVASVEPGTYTTAQQLALGSATAGATIRFTTDGSEPTEASPAVSAPLDLTEDTTTTLRARAFRADWLPSAELSGTWVVTGTVATPVLTPPPGGYTTGQSVVISTATADATVVYTLDGSEPDAGSAVYTAPIDLPLGTERTLRARALRAAWEPSAVAGGAYVVQPDVVEAPVFSVPPGTYPTARTLTVSSPTPGAVVHLTTDGSAPTTDSPVSAGPLDLSEGSTTRVRALAARPGWVPSAVVEGTWVIEAADPDTDTVDSGDSGEPDTDGEPADSGDGTVVDDTDPATTDPAGGCGCVGTGRGSGLPWAVLGLALVGLRRRRAA